MAERQELVDREPCIDYLALVELWHHVGLDDHLCQLGGWRRGSLRLERLGRRGQRAKLVNPLDRLILRSYRPRELQN